MTKLRVHTPQRGNVKVTNHRFETICELLHKAHYSPRAVHTLNEMVHAWNVLYSKGVPKERHFVGAPHNKEFSSLDEVETYAKELGLRVILTQTVKGSNNYLVQLQK